MMMPELGWITNKKKFFCEFFLFLNNIYAGKDVKRDNSKIIKIYDMFCIFPCFKKSVNNKLDVLVQEKENKFVYGFS